MAKRLLLGLLVILGLASAGFAVQLTGFGDVLDPLLLCDQPQFHFENITLLDDCVVKGNEANFRACYTNNGGPAYFPLITLDDALRHHVRQGNFYEGTRCYDFRSNVTDFSNVDIEIDYIVGCEYIATHSYKIEYEGGRVRGRMYAPTMPICENTTGLEKFLLAPDESPRSLDNNQLYISSCTVKPFGRHFSRLRLCVENNMTQLLRNIWVTANADDVNFLVNRNRIGGLAHGYAGCVNLYATEPALSGVTLAVSLDYTAEDNIKRTHSVEYTL